MSCFIVLSSGFSLFDIDLADFLFEFTFGFQARRAVLHKYGFDTTLVFSKVVGRESKQ